MLILLVFHTNHLVKNLQVKSFVHLSVQINKEQLAVEQKLDPSLVHCVAAADAEKREGEVNYFWDEGILIRR